MRIQVNEFSDSILRKLNDWKDLPVGMSQYNLYQCSIPDKTHYRIFKTELDDSTL
jgi:hypothetical protein